MYSLFVCWTQNYQLQTFKNGKQLSNGKTLQTWSGHIQSIYQIINNILFLLNHDTAYKFKSA